MLTLPNAAELTRNDRRRQAKEDERLLARGLRPGPLDPAQLIALMRLLHGRLEESRQVLSIEPMMAFFQANMRHAVGAAPRKMLACRMGCSHCCHAWVSARAPEVLFLTRVIPARERNAITASVAAAYAVTGTLGTDERDSMSAPCPLLKDDRCQLYDARPATCRTAVSQDAAACARAFRPGAADEMVPAPEIYLTLRRGYSIALAAALKRSGFPSGAYELNAALHTALVIPDAEPSWLRGEPVFAGVQTEPGPDPFTVPGIRRLYEAAWAGW